MNQDMNFLAWTISDMNQSIPPPPPPPAGPTAVRQLLGFGWSPGVLRPA